MSEAERSLSRFLLVVGAAAAVLISGPASAQQARVIKLDPGVTAASLKARPDTDLLELSDGRRIPLGDIRRLGALSRRMKAAVPGAPRPAALTLKPSAGRPDMSVKSAADLADALRLPDTATVELPSGRRATAALLRLLQPQVELRTGRRLRAAPGPGPSGEIVKVSARTDWREVFKKPDGTVLESPDGTRITLADLKRSIASGKGPSRGRQP